MGRGMRVRLVKISDKRMRQAALRKRKKSCIKRLQAIHQHCRAKVYIIRCDGPNDLGSNDDNGWPPRPKAAMMLAKFLSMSQRERSEKLVTQEKVIQGLLTEDLKWENDEVEQEEMMNDLMIDPASIQLHKGN